MPVCLAKAASTSSSAFFIDAAAKTKIDLSRAFCCACAATGAAQNTNEAASAARKLVRCNTTALRCAFARYRPRRTRLLIVMLASYKGTVVPRYVPARARRAVGRDDDRTASRGRQAMWQFGRSAPFPRGERCYVAGEHLGALGDARAGDKKRVDRGRVRLHHRRCGLCRLPTRQSFVRRSQQTRTDPRSRWQRQLDLVSYSGRLFVRDRQSAFGLVFQNRAGAGIKRPQLELSARQGDRRLLGDQRDGLYARASRGLRSLETARA